MEIRNLYIPFDLGVMEVSEYTSQPYKNTFFELVFILEGRGVQVVNDMYLPYAADKMFMFFPQDSNKLMVEQHTRLFFIRFNESYLKEQSKVWLQKIEYIFNTHNHLPGCILANVTDKPLVRAIADALIRESQNTYPNKTEVLEQLVNTIITIAARNITLMGGRLAQNETTTDFLPVLNYIHQNVYSPELLSNEQIAAKCNLSVNYVGEFFKRNTGISIQQYIAQYRLKLIETRLLYTQMRIGEIATEFGFTDISHLNRLFKKHKGISPSQYRSAKILNS